MELFRKLKLYKTDVEIDLWGNYFDICTDFILIQKRWKNRCAEILTSV